MSEPNVPPQQFGPIPPYGSNPQAQPPRAPGYAPGAHLPPAPPPGTYASPGGNVPPQGGYAPPSGSYMPPQGGYGNVPPTYTAAPQPPLSPEADKQFAMWSHFGGALLGFIPPLVLWLLFRQRGPRTDTEAKEALNWQITISIALLGMGIIRSVFSAIVYATAGYALVGLLDFLISLVGIVNIVFSIIAGTRVYAGGSYRYPFAFRFIK